MLIIGVDYHASDQYIAFVDTETGERGERRLNHSDGEVEKFYRELAARGLSVRVGMEATGYSRWFERQMRTRLARFAKFTSTSTAFIRAWVCRGR